MARKKIALVGAGNIGGCDFEGVDLFEDAQFLNLVFQVIGINAVESSVDLLFQVFLFRRPVERTGVEQFVQQHGVVR